MPMFTTLIVETVVAIVAINITHEQVSLSFQGSVPTAGFFDRVVMAVHRLTQNHSQGSL